MGVARRRAFWFAVSVALFLVPSWLSVLAVTVSVVYPVNVVPGPGVSVWFFGGSAGVSWFHYAPALVGSEAYPPDLVGLSGFQWLSSRVGTFVQVPGWMLLPAWAAAHGVSYLLFRSWRRAAAPRRCATCGYLADGLPQCPECGTRRRVTKEVTGDDPSSAQ
jgi:hypothetical protein